MVSLIQAPIMPPSLPQKSLKRDASHLSSPPPTDSANNSSSANNNSSSSQNKRLRVAFDDKVDVRIMDDWTAKPLDLVKDEVRSALEGHLRSGAEKDDSAYEQLRMVFVSAQSNDSSNAAVSSYNSEAPSTALLKKYLVALSGRVSELKACGKLVHAVLDVNWLGRDDGFVALYVRFLGTLGSAVPGFLRTLLDRLVGHFVEGKRLLSASLPM
jgi:RNA polymerase I-specific transcription initiation factor RRN3